MWTTPAGLLATLTAGVAASGLTVAAVNATSYAVTDGALPPGLVFNGSTGAIGGTPVEVAETATATFTVTATNAHGAPQEVFSIAVAPNPPAWTTRTGSLASGAVGAAYSVQLAATSLWPLQYAVTGGALPDGLALNGATGVVSGTPATPMWSSFVVTASDGTASSQQTFSIAIAAAGGSGGGGGGSNGGGMTTSFFHGVETVEIASASQPVALNPSAVVGIVGVADGADPAVFPLNEPVLLNSQPSAALKLAATHPANGDPGTLLAAVQQAYAEGAGQVVVVRVQGATLSTGAPDIQTEISNVIGSQAAKTGLYALLGARSAVGVQPRTIIAPGFTAWQPAATGGGLLANPVVSAALPIAAKLRGRVYADTPSTSDTAALAYRELYADARLVLFYPQVLVWDTSSSQYVAMPASASAAGLTARVHQQLGFWYSPSNQTFQGVGGTSSAIDWAMSDPSCEANILNAAQIATIVNLGQQDEPQYSGWRRWGNGNCSGDANYAFEAVRTTLDMVYDALDDVTLWAVDKPPSPQLLRDMTNRANDFFKWGTNIGFLVGGKCWLDPELNPSSQLVQGVWTWSIDPEAPAPMEHIIYQSTPNAGYYAQEVAGLASLVAVNNG